MATRRQILKRLIKGSAIAGTGGLVWGTTANQTKPDLTTLRPPGAIAPNNFIKACIKCGKCVEACPYDTLNLATLSDKKGIGTPFFEPRKIPCYMCTDYPCVEACPSKALDIKELVKDEEVANINNAQMGLAVIHKETCIAYWGVQCDACYRACPLMDSAIVLDMVKNTTTGKHANLQPVVYSDVCTGCGKCEHVCVVEKPAIRVLPRELAVGKVGDHYVKSWDKEDELRINNIEDNSKSEDKDIESALDYLNDDNLLDE